MRKHKILVIGSSKYYSHTFESALYPDVEFAFINHRGFHETYDTKPYIEQTLVNDIEQCRKDIGWEKFSILGHSIHAFMAIDYAEQYPQHIEKVILMSTSPVVGDKVRFESDQLWQHEATDARKAALQYNIVKEEQHVIEMNNALHEQDKNHEKIDEMQDTQNVFISTDTEKIEVNAEQDISSNADALQATNTTNADIFQSQNTTNTTDTSKTSSLAIGTTAIANDTNVQIDATSSQTVNINSPHNQDANITPAATENTQTTPMPTEHSANSTEPITSIEPGTTLTPITQTSSHTQINPDGPVAKILRNMQQHEQTNSAWHSPDIEVLHENQADKYNQEHHISYDQIHAHHTEHNTTIMSTDHNEGARDLSEMWESSAIPNAITDAFIRRMITYTPMLWYDYEFDASLLWKNVHINHDWANYIWGKFWIHKNLGIAISRMNKPVILYSGKYDYWNPVSMWSDYRNLSNLRIQVFHRSGHNPQYEEKVAFANSLNNWLNE